MNVGGRALALPLVMKTLAASLLVSISIFALAACGGHVVTSPLEGTDGTTKADAGKVGNDAASPTDAGIRVDGHVTPPPGPDPQEPDADVRSFPRPDPSICPGLPTGNACVQCCAAAKPNGANDITLSGFNCMCNDCSATCKSNVCGNTAPPQDACIACVKRSLTMECPNDQAFTQHCTGECREYAKCVESCPN